MYNIDVIRENKESILFGSVNLYIDIPAVLRMILDHNSRVIGFRIWKVTKPGYKNQNLNLWIPTETVETIVGINDDFLAAICELHELWLEKSI